jgi:iron transport multicopper oxidase
MHTVLLLLLLSTVKTRASSIGPSGSLIVGNANLSPDGFSRSTTVVNGQLPGPVISAEKVAIQNILLKLTSIPPG